jgi:hypothetical protein
LLVYGYVLDPPTGDVEAAEVKASLHPTHRTYRAEKTYGVSSGKWYYEVEILSSGSVSLGWALTDAAPDAALGRQHRFKESVIWDTIQTFFWYFLTYTNTFLMGPFVKLCSKEVIDMFYSLCPFPG